MTPVISLIVGCVVISAFLMWLAEGRKWVVVSCTVVSVVLIVAVLGVVDQRKANHWKVDCLLTPGNSVRMIEKVSRSTYKYGCFDENGKLVSTREAAGDKSGIEPM